MQLAQDNPEFRYVLRGIARRGERGFGDMLQLATTTTCRINTRRCNTQR